MRTKIGIAVAVLLIVIVSVTLLRDQRPPPEPPLRAGMQGLECDRIMSKLGYQAPIVDEEEEALSYWQEPDWIGNRHQVLVNRDEVCRVSSWRVKPLPRTWPSWLAKTMKAVGW
jgi:hypothetical protein